MGLQTSTALGSPAQILNLPALSSPNYLYLILFTHSYPDPVTMTITALNTTLTVG